MIEDKSILNKIFTQNSMKAWINNSENTSYSDFVNNFESMYINKKNKEIIRDIYEYLNKNYRNEYFYKNLLFNKLLLGKHSINTTTALTEIPINKSKADFILINGKAVVYEIKTGLDSFERLDNQIEDYFKGFSNVNVVTCEENYEKLLSVLKNENVGIYVLTKRNTFSKKRESKDEYSNLMHKTMFDILRKNEFENIILKHYGELPITTQFKYYDECFDLFSNIEKKKAYRYMVMELKKRVNVDKENFNKYIPYELKFLAYFFNLRKQDYIKIYEFLNNIYRRK